MNTLIAISASVGSALFIAGLIFVLRKTYLAGRDAARSEAKAEQIAAENKAIERQLEMAAEAKKIHQDLDHADDSELRERLKQWAPK